MFGRRLLFITKPCFTITKNEKQLWQNAQRMACGPIHFGGQQHDGQSEINLLVWKPGDYGSSKPFWVPKMTIP